MENTDVANIVNLVGTLKGHDGWVTSIAINQNMPERIVTSSRDKSLIVWDISQSDDSAPGSAVKRLRGHNSAVQDVSLSNDGKYAVSASWDKTLRVWDLDANKSILKFIGHTKDVFSVSLSPDNHKIVSAGRDRSIKVWNTEGECKYTITQGQHTDWISCVRFSPASGPTKQDVVTTSWDKVVKVWDMTECKLKCNLVGHTAPITSVTISPDGTLCATGGKGGTTLLWDIPNSANLFSLENKSNINALSFSPNHYWLAVACDDVINIWDIEKQKLVQVIKRPVASTTSLPWTTSATWTADGSKLLVGTTDNEVLVFEVDPSIPSEE